MKRVAVFGNAGGGKSTLAKRLADLTGLPLYPLDRIRFRAGGSEVPHEEYLKAHADLLRQDAWIIDGFGSLQSAWEHFSKADTLVYVDLPLVTHAWWVTKRLIQGLFVTPEGWPDNSPMWSSTMNSYRVIWLCHRRLTPGTGSSSLTRPLQARSSREVANRDDGFPRCNRARIFACLIHRLCS